MNKKELTEKLNDLREVMQSIVDTAKAENRVLTDDENAKFTAAETEAKQVEATMQAMDKTATFKPVRVESELDPEQKAIKDFEAYLRTGEISQSATDMEKGDNGAVIPASIANRIIDKIIEISPLFSDAERYNVKGTLTIPYWDETTDHITVDYATEFSAPDSHTGKFSNISLTGFLASALVDISKSLINNSSFDIVGFVINRMALNIAAWIEKELLYGTNTKITGMAPGITQYAETTANNKITGDDLIGLQEMVPDWFQENAYFIMNRKTREAIRKIKDGDGVYLLNRDLNARWGYTLLGKDVYCSDNVFELKGDNAGKFCVFYGDMTGLAVKVSEDINIEVLREAKAVQHVVEVVGFVELDAKVQNAQKLAGLKVKS